MASFPPLFGREYEGLGSLFREIEKSFDDFSRRAPSAGFSGFGGTSITPKINIAEGKDGIEVTAELPGVNEKDIDIMLADGMLTIRGEKKIERDEADQEKDWHLIERSYGAFSRSIPLPYQPDATKTEAKFENGVLHIRLPKPSEMARKEKKIEIRKS